MTSTSNPGCPKCGERMYQLAMPQDADGCFACGYSTPHARYVPTNAEWAAGHAKSVAEEVNHRPLSACLIDVAALCFLRGLAIVGWVKRRVR